MVVAYMDEQVKGKRSIDREASLFQPAINSRIDLQSAQELDVWLCVALLGWHQPFGIVWDWHKSNVLCMVG